MKDDVIERKSKVTFVGQLMGMMPKIKHHWESLIKVIEKEPKQGLVITTEMTIEGVPDIRQLVEGEWKKDIKEQAWETHT